MVETIREEAVCPHCEGTGWRLVEEEGEELVRRCECAETDRRRRLLDQAAIPARYRHCSFDSFEIWDKGNETLRLALKRAREFVDLYPHVDKGLLLMGPVGIGKTHLAVAVLQELITTKGAQGRLADFTSLVLEIQMTFDGAGDKRQILAPLMSAELLVLDELGAGKTSPWVMDLLYYLVNSRYMDGKLTIFTTNYLDPPNQPRTQEEYLADRISRRIRSRLFEMCRKVELRGGDYRKHRFADSRYERNA